MRVVEFAVAMTAKDVKLIRSLISSELDEMADMGTSEGTYTEEEIDNARALDAQLKKMEDACGTN